MDATAIPLSDPVYAPDHYGQSHLLGKAAKQAGIAGLRYHSVRSPGNHCWALLTPRHVTSIVQSAHYEMIWSGEVIGINQISNA